MLQSQVSKIPITKRPLKTRGLLGDTNVWLQQLAERDTALWGMTKPLWVIDNKIYDLTQFASKHPGGSSWINLTKGQDLTILFKTHHLEQEKVRQTLQKYYVGEAPIKQQNRFDMTTTDQLRRMILKKYSVSQLRDTTNTDRTCTLIVLIWFTILALSGYFRSYLLAMVCGFMMLSLYGIGHLYTHRKDDKLLRHAFLLIGFSAKQQQIMHAISHHPYANTELDYQYTGFQPILRYSRIYPQNKWFNAILVEVLFLLVGPSNIITKLIVSPIVHKHAPSYQHLLTLLEIVYIYIFCGDMYVALKLWFVMMFFYGFTFGKMIVCPHRQGHLWSEGAPEVRDFILHNIVTTGQTQNKNKISTMTSLLLYAGFNIHVVHHLFSTIDMDKIFQINQVFVDYCKQKGWKIYTSDLMTCNKNMISFEFKKQIFNLKNFLNV